MRAVATVTVATFKEAIRQPLYSLLIAFLIFFIGISAFIPYFTFGEDTKVLIDTGLASIVLGALFIALWTASVSVAEDIEDRTAVTVLSKPVNRRQFILGKFFGILLSIALFFLILGVVFMLVLYYKVGYEAREVARPIPTFQERLAELWRAFPALVLAFFEVVVLAAISVAVSTRLPLVANFIVCVSIYFLGHLAPVLVQISKSSFELVQFTARMAETALPTLAYFNVGPAIATGSVVPWTYVLYALFYCVLYTSIAILLAFTLFEDRDLA